MNLAKRCYLGLGTNVGNLKQNLKQAINLIKSVEGVTLVKVSSLYLTKAWGKIDQNDFLNSALSIDVLLEPNVLLKAIQKIEIDMGRKRIEKWGPRIIDIDILLYADYVVKQPQLNIPHPYLTQRSFVLAPLYELNNNLYIPNKGSIKSFFDKKCELGDIIRVM